MPSGAEEGSHTKRQARAEESGSTAQAVVASTREEMVTASDRVRASGGRAHPMHARWAKDRVSGVAIVTVGRHFERELEQQLWLDGVVHCRAGKPSSAIGL